jgi:hypothetical protein
MSKVRDFPHSIEKVALTAVANSTLHPTEHFRVLDHMPDWYDVGYDDWYRASNYMPIYCGKDTFDKVSAGKWLDLSTGWEFFLDTGTEESLSLDADDVCNGIRAFVMLGNMNVVHSATNIQHVKAIVLCDDLLLDIIAGRAWQTYAALNAQHPIEEQFNDPGTYSMQSVGSRVLSQTLLKHLFNALMPTLSKSVFLAFRVCEMANEQRSARGSRREMGMECMRRTGTQH